MRVWREGVEREGVEVRVWSEGVEREGVKREGVQRWIVSVECVVLPPVLTNVVIMARGHFGF